jgi:hypothetical protein
MKIYKQNFIYHNLFSTVIKSRIQLLEQVKANNEILTVIYNEKN